MLGIYRSWITFPDSWRRASKYAIICLRHCMLHARNPWSTNWDGSNGRSRGETKYHRIVIGLTQWTITKLCIAILFHMYNDLYESRITDNELWSLTMLCLSNVIQVKQYKNISQHRFQTMHQSPFNSKRGILDPKRVSIIQFYILWPLIDFKDKVANSPCNMLTNSIRVVFIFLQ